MSRISSDRPTTNPPRSGSPLSPESTTSETAARGNAERLLVLTVVGAVLAATVIVGLTLIVSGRLHRLTEISRAQTEAIEALQARIIELESQPSRAPAQSPATRPAATSPTTQARQRSSTIREAELLGRLERQLATDADGAVRLLDRIAAARLRDELLAELRPTEAPPPVVALLAELSTLLGDRQLGLELAEIAANRGASVERFALLAVTHHAAAGEHAEALEAVELLTQSRDDATRSLLLAEIAFARGDNFEVDDLLDRLRSVSASSLQLQRQLRFAQLLIQRERYARAAALLADGNQSVLDRSPLARRLRAILLAARGNPDEALAAIDAVLDANPDAILKVWRAAALVRGRQFASARAILGPGPVADEHPAAAYWRVRAELDAGNADLVSALIDRSPPSAALFELRGRMLLDTADGAARDGRRSLTDAIRALEESVRLDNGRGAAHLLLSIAYAKLDRADDARAALKRAVSIDPMWLEAALAAEILTRIAPAQQLREWAGV